MAQNIEKQVTLNAPIGRVWEALTDHRQFGEWFKVKLDKPFAPNQSSKGQITHPGYEQFKVEMTVKKMEEEHLFSYTWHPYPFDPKRDYSKEDPTLVEFRLEKNQQGTTLFVKETGFERLPEDRRSEAFQKHDDGWREQLENIQSYVEKSV